MCFLGAHVPVQSRDSASFTAVNKAVPPLTPATNKGVSQTAAAGHRCRPQFAGVVLSPVHSPQQVEVPVMVFPGAHGIVLIIPPVVRSSPYQSLPRVVLNDLLRAALRQAVPKKSDVSWLGISLVPAGWLLPAVDRDAYLNSGAMVRCTDICWWCALRRCSCCPGCAAIGGCSYQSAYPLEALRSGWCWMALWRYRDRPEAAVIRRARPSRVQNSPLRWWNDRNRRPARR